MRPGELMQEARHLADWLRGHTDDFLPLEIVRVDVDVSTDHDGEPSVNLTVVLEDPADPDAGWPIAEVFGLYRAVNERSLASELGTPAYVHLQSVSDEAA